MEQLQVSELLSSITEDPNLQIAAAAALVSAAVYQLALEASRVLSPRLAPIYSRLKPAERTDWDSRVPSTLHALVVSALCIWALCYSGDFAPSSSSSTTTITTQPGPTAGVSAAASGTAAASAAPIALRATPTSFAIIGVSAGYFAMDCLLLAATPALSTPEMALHHAAALASLGSALQVGAMHVYLLLVLLSELTTPFVNLRWWLDKAGAKSNKLYAANGLLLLLVWGVARVAPILPFYAHVAANWALVRDAPPHALVLLLSVPALLGGLNLLWFIKIVRGCIKLLRGGGGAGGGDAAAGSSSGGGVGVGAAAAATDDSGISSSCSSPAASSPTSPHAAAAGTQQQQRGLSRRHQQQLQLLLQQQEQQPGSKKAPAANSAPLLLPPSAANVVSIQAWQDDPSPPGSDRGSSGGGAQR